MSYYIFKIVLTTALVVAVSEVSKRSSLAGAVVASVPLISVLAMAWLYAETKDIYQVSSLARNIFWLVLPSLVLFLVLPRMLERGYDLHVSFGVSIGAMIVFYFLMVVTLRRIGMAA